MGQRQCSIPSAACHAASGGSSTAAAARARAQGRLGGDAAAAAAGMSATSAVSAFVHYKPEAHRTAEACTPAADAAHEAAAAAAGQQAAPEKAQAAGLPGARPALRLSRKTLEALEEATNSESEAGGAAAPLIYRAVNQALPPDAVPPADD